MLERTNNLPELFDQSKIVEVTDPDDPTRRYCLCRNPLTAEREGRTRSELVERSKMKTQHRSTVKMAGITFKQTNEPTPDQARLLALLSPATAVKHTATEPVK